jgi:hypothetical protein
MVFRVLEYVVQIYKRQLQHWLRRHKSAKGFRFQPVLPIVLYSGSRPWAGLGGLADLVEAAADLGARIPSLDPLFLNLWQTSAAELESRGGYFGWALELVQQKAADAAAFQGLLARVVGHLEQMSAPDRGRWLELLSYFYALVYHERPDAEHQHLHNVIEAAVRNDARQKEVEAFMRTMADVHKEQAQREEAVRSRQQTLVRQMRKKFGRVPAKVVRRIEGTIDVTQLETWLDEFATANQLADISVTQEE